MSNRRSRIEYGVIEYKDTVVFHPGYYIMEIIDESGLTQNDFANRLGTTPKNLSVLLRGKESLSVEMALKLSNMLGTSVSFWLNLQNAYDTAIAETEAEAELDREISILKTVGYSFFRKHFGLPDHARNLVAQVKELRKFLGVSSLCVLNKRDLTASFKTEMESMDTAAVIRANALVQIAIRESSKIAVPKYDRKKFEEAIGFALTQTSEHSEFLPRVKEAFLEAGVILVVLPNLPGSKTNGATKKAGDGVMLMVNDRNRYADTFWFTLLHEAGHVLNGDFGLSVERERGEKEEAANQFARNALIPPAAYSEFVALCRLKPKVTSDDVLKFANEIDRDPGIVVGRLMKDGYVAHSNAELNALRKQYRVCR